VLTLTSVSSSVKTAKGLPVDYLSGTAARLLDALQQVAELVKAARGYHQNTSQVTFFAPVESVALAIGVSRQTVYNRLPELRSKGLVQQKGHYCSHNGQTRSDGSLWAVKLDLGTTGAAKIDYDWLKGSYRSLGDDIATGRTAWKILQSNPRVKDSVDISYILTFALPTDSEPIKYDRKAVAAPVLETLLDVPYAPVEGRSGAVDSSAEAVRIVLGGESKNINLYRWLVWRLLKLQQSGQRDYFYAVFLMVQRAGVEKRENACKNPTGLLISRLKNTGIWKELQNAPPGQIGTKPN
jgi:DNA-binding Lrp family transcriptional regulator